jgi:hypothetical protein
MLRIAALAPLQRVDRHIERFVDALWPVAAAPRFQFDERDFDGRFRNGLRQCRGDRQCENGKCESIAAEFEFVGDA